MTLPKITKLVPTYTVGEIDYTNELDDHLHINRTDLSVEFAEHSERFAYYSTCYELAADKLRRLEIDLKRQYAVLDIQKRQEAQLAGMKLTEKMVENSVLVDDLYVALQDECISAEMQLGVLKAARDSMAARKEMLVSLGANFRTEFRADATLLSNEMRNR